MYNFKFIKHGVGVIQIDEFKEKFESDHSYWQQEQYQNQWESDKEILNYGKAACFITSITEPKTTNFIRSWVCYPINNEFVFQEHVIFLEDLSEPFDEYNPHKHILTYESVSEDGDEISEWRTKI